MTMLNPINPVNGKVKVSYLYHGKTKELEVDFDALNRKEVVKVDNMHPNLQTQAKYAIEGIERHKNSILTTASKMLEMDGLNAAALQMDAIVNCITVKWQTMEDDDTLSKAEFREVMDYAYSMVVASKNLLDIHWSLSGIEHELKMIDYAQKGVLI